MRQDRLILHAIQTSVTTLVLPIVSRFNTAIEAWNKLAMTYADKSHTRMLDLLDALMKVSKEGKIVANYMQGIKIIIDDLSMIGHHLSDGEIIIHSLNGIGPE